MGFKWNGVDPITLRVFDRDTPNAAEHSGVACIRYCAVRVSVYPSTPYHFLFCCSLEGIPENTEQTVNVTLSGSLSGTVTLELTFQKH